MASRISLIKGRSKLKRDKINNMDKEKLELLKNLLQIFFCEEAEGQGVKELNLEEYNCKELITAIEDKLNY